ncbi:hypothetical protein CM318V1_210093 [Carnobacterium maltaromaticum]|nr:hypothetical protein CM318V1_210093 [Carnobacterium maltaromaticum]
MVVGIKHLEPYKMIIHEFLKAIPVYVILDKQKKTGFPA